MLPQYEPRIVTPRKRMLRRVTGIVTLVTLSVCGVPFFALTFTTWAYDEMHVLTLTCTVESARGTISDSQLRRGESSRAVVIETKGCGKLVLTGVGRDDYVEVAPKHQYTSGPVRLHRRRERLGFARPLDASREHPEGEEARAGRVKSTTRT
ncbi:hypothetical protein BIV04_07545 [Frigoribacterium sp. MCBA15_019]|nr:hypothetical protein BIV04_07545 [Frigoribacterium sp. MCBA15_019]